jgi:hypothetical protein
MGAVTVRVVPRSGRVAVEVGEQGVTVRVRAAPEGGRATEQARRALADALHVAPSRITLVRGARTRVKTFEIAGLTADDLRVRLEAT